MVSFGLLKSILIKIWWTTFGTKTWHPPQCFCFFYVRSTCVWWDWPETDGAPRQPGCFLCVRQVVSSFAWAHVLSLPAHRWCKLCWRPASLHPEPHPGLQLERKPTVETYVWAWWVCYCETEFLVVIWWEKHIVCMSTQDVASHAPM